MKKGRVDIIIPAYKAHGTIERTLCSIAIQTVAGDLDVIIVNDGCPEGGYGEYVERFGRDFRVREVVLERNSGPGTARQKGIEAGDGEFFTCIDADDTFAGAIALQTLRGAASQHGAVKCVSSRFDQMTEDIRRQAPHVRDMVWMFGKIYRREWVEKNGIYMNGTRANEDTGYNTWVSLLCDNAGEQVAMIDDLTYYWHLKEDSITRINGGQYGFDQCMCGWTDNMIWAIENARKSRPFSGAVPRKIAEVMVQLYFYHVETHERKPVFEAQNWEYTKKFYHRLYKRIEPDISDAVLSQIYSAGVAGNSMQGHLAGIIPYMGIREFFDRLRSEEYDPMRIYDVWEEMARTEEGRGLIENNVRCGVCPEGYTERPEGHEKGGTE